MYVLKLIDNALGNILTLVQNTAVSKIADYLINMCHEKRGLSYILG